MKHITYTVLSLCFTFCFNKAVCQQDYILQSSYGGSFEDQITGVLSTELNDILIAGPSKSFPYAAPIGVPAEFYITKINAAGDQVWDVVEGDISELDLLFSAIKTYDSNYLAVGYASYQGSPNHIPGDIRLLKVDDDGNTIYSKLIEYGGVTSEARDICYTSDGNYMIAGARIDSFAWKHYPLLTKINESGDVIWAKDYKQDTIVALFGIRQALDGGYFAYGQNTENLAFVLRYTADGEVLWWKDLRALGLGYEGIETIYDMEVTPSGSAIVMVNGHFTTFIPFECLNQPQEFSYLLVFNMEGEVTTQKILCSVGNTIALYNDITLTNDGGILLTSYNSLIKLNSNWETEWQLANVFPNGNDYQFKKSGQFEDNSFYAVGELIVGNDNTDYFIVRIPEDGVNAVTTINGNNDLISLYPNPANSILTVGTNVALSSANLKIYNTQGQLVTSSIVEGQQTTIDVSLFAAGLYYLTLQSKEGVITRKIEVVR